MEDTIQQQSIKEINSEIIAITMLIEERYPELTSFLSEMPVTIPNQQNPEMTLKIVKDYLDSLKTILNDYIAKHC